MSPRSTRDRRRPRLRLVPPHPGSRRSISRSYESWHHPVSLIGDAASTAGRPCTSPAQQREDGLLEMLGVFRVASRRSIVNAIFDGHPFAANPTLGALVRRGLIVQKKVPEARAATRSTC